MSGSERALQTDDLYLRKPVLRRLDLLEALLAWGFDGVKQGVYSILTRQALRDLMPANVPLCNELAEVNTRIAELTRHSLPSAHEKSQATALIKKIDAAWSAATGCTRSGEGVMRSKKKPWN